MQGRAAEAETSASPAAEVAEKRGDLRELRGQIESLRKELAASEGSRADAADQLKDAEREISVTQRDLHRLAGQRRELQAALRELAGEARTLEARLAGQQAQLERLVHRQYLRGTPDALSLLLNGDDPNQLARDLYYLGVIGRERRQLLGEIRESLRRKQALAADARARADELGEVETRQREQHARLLAQREQRKATLAKISAQISAQRREIGNLQRNEKRLSQLVERLARIIAARPKPRPQESTPQRSPRPEIANSHAPEALPAGRFAQLKGSLRLPVRGTLANRFGTVRQEGSTWKGLFIRAATGSEVKAIAGGRVVFADWMRGFGNLLIVNHGDGYLSIYGNNDALLKQVGDAVRGGDDVAAVGNSGGNPESGLYFELRHQGQPLDPLKWVNLK